MTELSPGTVTIADLYRELVGMRSDVAKALTRIEVLDSRGSDADASRLDHESRIRSLEAFRWKITGIAVAAGAVAGVLSGAAVHLH